MTQGKGLALLLLLAPLVAQGQDFSRIDIAPEQVTVWPYFRGEGASVLGDKLYFHSGASAPPHDGIYYTDGTPEGTGLLYPFQVQAMAEFTPSFAFGNHLLIGGATEEDPRNELWISDGTPEGTELLKVIGQDMNGSHPWGFVEMGGEVFFTARDQSSFERGLWKTDGTADGTVPLAPDESWSGLDWRTWPDAVLDGIVFATADHEDTGTELWKSDGTPEGTVMVKDILEGPVGSEPRNLLVHDGLLYFSANDGSGGQLFVSDGTAAGTTVVKNIRPGYSPAEFAGFSEMVAHQGLVYFSANDGEHGRELWVSDGTEAGTYMVKDINPGADAGMNSHYSIVSTGGFIYFGANDGEHGWQLWRSDGTEAGTVMVAEIVEGPSYPWENFSYMVGLNDKLYFTAKNGADDLPDFRLWESDGTAEGTQVIAPEGATVDQPLPTLNATSLGNGLIFAANFDGTGPKVWRYGGEVAQHVAEAEESRLPTAYPNPGHGRFTVEVDVPGNTPYEVWDMTGRRVASGSTASPRIEVDITHEPAGLYLFRMGGRVQLLSKY